MNRGLARILFFLCALCVLRGESAFAASPVLSGISPRGAQRGIDSAITFSGARLSDAKEILFYSPGFSTTKLEVVNDGNLKVTLKIAADCKLGEHIMRVRTASGISEMRTFWVGAMPVIQEKEPNSDFATPQKIPLNVTVQGVVDYEDVDYFAVECKKGQRLSVEIEAMRLANTLFDPYIAILDSKRFELASSDDSPLLGQDGMCSIVVPTDGTYIVQVRESAYAGNGACGYRLHVGTFPRPQAVVPAGGKAGEEITVRFIGDPRGDFTQKIKLPAKATDKFGVFAEDKDGIAPSAIPFRVIDSGNVVEVEPNDTPATATKAELPNAFNGVIDKPGDVDWFRFKATKGQTFDIHCYARRLGSPLDSVMTLAYGNGNVITSNDDAIGPDSYFRITFPADGEYVIGVTDHLGKGGANYFYRIEFTPVQPTATVSIPKVGQYSQERQAISVPRGNRMATLVSVGRGNFGGEVVLGAENLPAGLTLNAENVPANLDVIPVVFEASPTADVGSKFADFTVRHTEPKHPKITTSFYQMAELILGAPGQSIYWTAKVDREAIAVTEEVPYSIRIIEPKVPLVQNGSMQLKIVVDRKPGFTAPITVYPLFNPPGVSSASSVSIPANGKEANLPMNAASNAQVRKWKTAVVAVSDAGKGPMWVSSQLATIEVAAPFVVFAMERAAVEQGKETELFCKIKQLTAFPGKAKVKLLGLPFKVTTTELEITKDMKEVGFKLTTDKSSPAGIHRNLFCQIVITRDGEPIVSSTGYSELRLDVPIVKKDPPKTTTPVVVAKPPPVTKPVEKRLTRLEKLRLEQEEREKASKGGTPTPMPPKK